MRFADKFKQQVKDIDAKLAQGDFFLPAREPLILKKTEEKYYNIHKRSLPPGIDLPIVFGLSKSEAEFIVKTFLPVKRSNSSYIYYDIVPENANDSERSIYWNNTNWLTGLKSKLFKKTIDN